MLQAFAEPIANGRPARTEAVGAISVPVLATTDGLISSREKIPHLM
jgi:hypothetical protein